MGTHAKRQVRLVISHLEGSSGNFLARLLSGRDLQDQTLWRVDTQRHPDVLSTNGRNDFEIQIAHLDQHCIVVTHQFDINIIAQHFPQARVIQIWPDQLWGNVLYNACMKKSRVIMANEIDQHVINLDYWWQLWHQQSAPDSYLAYQQLRDRAVIESLLGGAMTDSQLEFFTAYWQRQLQYDLAWPQSPTGMEHLVNSWQIQKWFTPWSAAWAIFVHERTHQLQEHHRLWSIDHVELRSWSDVFDLENRYQTRPTDQPAPADNHES